MRFLTTGQNRKLSTFFSNFFIPEVTKLTLMLFLRELTGPFFGSFSVVLLCNSPTNRLRVKGSLSIQILVLLLPELELCNFRKHDKFPKIKMLYDYQGCWSNSFTVYTGLTINS